MAAHELLNGTSKAARNRSVIIVACRLLKLGRADLSKRNTTLAAGYILRRIGSAVPSLIGVILATFLLSRALPGDPAVYFAGPAANAESVQQVRESLGLDKSMPEQLVLYVYDLARGSLGNSLTTGQPVVDDLIQRLPASMELTFTALIVAILIAVPLGVFAAAKPNSLIDHFCRGTVTVAAAFPTFFVALLLVYVFYYLLGWAGRRSRLGGSTRSTTWRRTR